MISVEAVCVRCGEAKPIRAFYPQVLEGIVVRRDTCRVCCQELDIVRSRARQGRTGREFKQLRRS